MRYRRPVSYTHLDVYKRQLVDSSTDSADVGKMLNEMDKVDGIKWALGLDSLIGPSVPASMM